MTTTQWVQYESCSKRIGRSAKDFSSHTDFQTSFTATKFSPVSHQSVESKSIHARKKKQSVRILPAVLGKLLPN